MIRLETGSAEGEMILIVLGLITGEASIEFIRKIDLLAAGRATTIILDLSQCPGMNSESIGRILTVRKKLVEENRMLRIRACSDLLWDTFKKIKLDTLISIQKQPELVIEKRIGEVLALFGFMTADQVEIVLSKQRAGDRRLFGEIALSLGLIEDNALRRYADYVDKSKDEDLL
jgi:anti-anti-sigma regulatory factor